MYVFAWSPDIPINEGVFIACLYVSVTYRLQCPESGKKN